MPRLGLLPVIVREALGERTLPREPEPDLVMDGDEQVAAYAEAGRIDGVMAAAYLFHSARISQVIPGCARVVDIGCGPATQLAQVAQLNPDTQFLGVDLSAEMLSEARQHISSLGLNNIELMQADMTDLGEITAHSSDGVISTMALHHLPTRAHLDACLSEARRILKPGGALYLVDFGRLKTLKSVIYFAYMNARYQPHAFSLDYERSLRAAFLKEELEQLAIEHFGMGYTAYATFPMPVLVLIKSADRPTTSRELRDRVKAMREDLPKKYRQDLDLIRRLFRLGGLDNDPFR